MHYHLKASCLDGSYTCEIPELKNHKIFVSDCGPERPEIELLLGTDTYGLLLTGRVKSLKCGPVAVETHLGCVMGRSSTHVSYDTTTWL
ncbi:hypothetical protein PR048_030966 [Dryococelus australis]|uniref:Recombination activating protein 2 n=1 Tax=Dryococelus australis TaxID=614101 RepID=A0ABQ9GAE5_9NEOP|nr:hypothetical protein PR048_030966 [Dryococelus australis]